MKNKSLLCNEKLYLKRFAYIFINLSNKIEVAKIKLYLMDFFKSTLIMT